MTRRRSTRLGTAVVTASLALVGLAGAGSPVAAGQVVPPGLPSAPRGTVSYLLHADFAIGYEVEWREEQGDPDARCASWRTDSGTNEVHAGTYVRKKNGGIEGVWIPGSAAIYPRTLADKKTGGWADITAVGKATATMHRRWIQEGGSNWTPECPTSDPGPFRPSPNDCAGGRGRESTTPNAIARADMRVGTSTVLTDLTSTAAPGSRRAKMPSFSFYVAAKPPYRRCMTSPYAPEFVAGIALLLPQKKWVAALRKLKPSRKVRLKSDYSGTCVRDLGDQSTCEFTVSILMTIRRVGPGIAYP